MTEQETIESLRAQLAASTADANDQRQSRINEVAELRAHLAEADRVLRGVRESSGPVAQSAEHSVCTRDDAGSLPAGTSLHVPQAPTTGINAIIGQWPGDESKEEIESMLDEKSARESPKGDTSCKPAARPGAESRALRCPWPECGKEWTSEYDYSSCPFCMGSFSFQSPIIVSESRALSIAEIQQCLDARRSGLTNDGCAYCGAEDTSHTHTLLDGEAVERRLREVARRATEGMREAVLRICSDCHGSGKVELPCTMCGDSTYDHECDSQKVECVSCERLRSQSLDPIIAAACEEAPKMTPEMQRRAEFAREYFRELPPEEPSDTPDPDHFDETHEEETNPAQGGGGGLGLGDGCCLCPRRGYAVVIRGRLPEGGPRPHHRRSVRGGDEAVKPPRISRKALEKAFRKAAEMTQHCAACGSGCWTFDRSDRKGITCMDCGHRWRNQMNTRPPAPAPGEGEPTP